ncbi:aldehyde dehydrogenase [Coniophora puteana RWD-64-598 SS2]|uniref:Aldehyde dehydrogenase n=1 Tax=Coniophora puteana (strain RWD-64-598) TaxID=741705 RepID=A0A5M3M946_CONPW|nr:aldehyde dehydrogenase [Coniophora puteana RWD-64-598 SS2]EIW75446.1 aldehyde dehydrogenase [Coniophora puteana RWD-64-598 SS2]
MPKTFETTLDTPAFKGSLSVPLGLYINGEFVDPIEGGEIDVINPANGRIITSIAAGTQADIDRAVDAAERAYKTSWGFKVPGAQRGKMLAKLAHLMKEKQSEFAALDALANGKAYNTAFSRDNSGAIAVMEYYAGWADKISGKTIEVNENKMAYTRHEPIGVVGQIIPWNVPMFSLSLKLAPALATGNTVILKPSELTPLSALLFCTLVAAAGFPPGVVNIVNGYGASAGHAIAAHPRVRKVAFTGSTLTGRKIMEAAARSNLKPVTLELGGKSPTVVFGDADVEQAVKWAIHGIYFNHGQNCSAGSRIYVQDTIYDEFLRGFTEQARAIRVGDPFATDTYQGPQVSETQFQRIMSYIASGKESGATVHLGGQRIGSEGYFMQPTIFTECTPDMKIVQEEIFGPVACLMRFGTEEEVLERANDTSYGLAAAVFTKDIDRAIRVAHALEAGTAWINCANQTEISMPFGGFKQSGIGRELGEYALENYTNVKAVHVNIGIRM